MALRSDALPASEMHRQEREAPDVDARPVLSLALLHDPAWSPLAKLVRPAAGALELPERAVQFGTGAFLRGFVEYFLDEANTHGRFNGRVVVVGSTDSGRDRAFTTQDGLFTLQSVGADSAHDELRVVSSVSRALNARGSWQDVLAVARQSDIAVVFSNTTEAGFSLSELDVASEATPHSFPAKLARFLYERARAFNFDVSRGVVVIPCELLEDNGDVLRSLVESVARRWQLEPQFLSWLRDAVPFCNTLVDRIVPGAPPSEARERLESLLGYTDGLLTVAESYRLFVIEAGGDVLARLPFLAADRDIVVTDNIRSYRERKVRLLNGTHTGLAAVGVLASVETVDAAMRDENIAAFAHELLIGAIAPMVDAPEARAFGEDVLTRFANPHVHHRLTDIANQGTLKLRVRLLPVVQRYVQASQPVPRMLTVAFAAQLLLLHPEIEQALLERGVAHITDDLGARVRKHWEVAPGATDGTRRILSDTGIWLEDLTRLSTWAAQVADIAACILADGVRSVLPAGTNASTVASMVTA